jgi:hypothetical protein
LQRGRWRIAASLTVLLAGVITLAAPWLGHHPRLHSVLVALGCSSIAS